MLRRMANLNFADSDCAAMIADRVESEVGGSAASVLSNDKTPARTTAVSDHRPPIHLIIHFQSIAAFLSTTS
jgi:hypothetical protein